jgi:uridine kinase
MRGSAGRPLIIGIAGGSGSGKTTIAEAVLATLSGAVLIQHDCYYRHRHELTLAERSQVNYDHPDSLETELLIDHLTMLSKGATIDRPNYDFVSHLRASETDRIEPAPVIILEGILVLADSDLRERLDLRIYVDAEADIRLARRIRRDIEERGRTLQSVLEQYIEFVRPMYLEFIEPSKRYADLVIKEGYDPAAVATVVDKIRSRLAARHPSIYSAPS